MINKFARHYPYLLGALIFLFAQVRITFAADPQKCTQSTTCKIGEFLYNDDYTENTTATCTITSRDPNGDLYLNGVSLTQSNAYYSHSFTPTTLGTYPTQICCTVSSELMCLDKTFEVVAAVTGGGTSLTAADVWSYSDRSLTSFGSLVSDIWNYSSRSLTSFGGLVSDIWTRSERTLTQSVSVDTTSLATKSDLTEINKIIKDNKTLLQKLINQPARPSLNITNPTDFNKKITESQNVLNSLFTTTQNLRTRSQVIADNWSKLTNNQVKSELETLEKILGDINSKNDTSLVAHSNWLKATWNNDIFIDLSTKIDKTNTKLQNVSDDINKFSINSLYNSYLGYLNSVYEIDNLIGNSLSDQKSPTIFGFLNKQIIIDADFKKHHDDLQTILNTKKSNTQTSKQLKEIEAQILSQNQLKNYQEILESPKINSDQNISEDKEERNKIYRLTALINLNKIISLGNSTESVRYMWLEEGSVVFRTITVNPSKNETQNVSVKFNLPPEIKKEQIIAADPELKIDYDVTEGALVSTADLNLAPQESKVLAVKTQDTWLLNSKEVNNLKQQAENLAQQFNGSSLATQANNIKNEILKSLDTATTNYEQAISPEDKITSYRESALEIANAEEKINDLRLLLAQNVSSKSLPNTKNLAIIGVVLLGLAGFAFLSYYLKHSTQNNLANTASQNSQAGESVATNKIRSRHFHKETKNIHHRKVATLIILGLISSGLVSLTVSVGASILNYQKSKKITLETTEKINKNQIINLAVEQNQKVPVKSSPSVASPEVLSFTTSQQLYIYKKLNGWAKVGLSETEGNESWWINELYLK